MKNSEALLILTSSTDVHSIPPQTLAALIRWIIKNEIKPGGPYVSATPSQEVIQINHHIVRLFSTKNTPLKGALALLATHGNAPKIHTIRTATHSRAAHPHYARILKEIHGIFGKNSPVPAQVLRTIQATDINGEISSLTTLLHKSMQHTTPLTRSSTLFDCANIYTWLAYSLYDTFYDTPGTPPTHIPLANIALQTALSTYVQAEEAIIPIAQHYFRMSDMAQLQELTCCRFNPLKPLDKHSIPAETLLRRLLSERSIAHCIGPLYVFNCMKNLTKTEKRKLKESLHAYCAARQLLDDLHDWQDDFQAGRWTYVTARLARNIDTTHTNPIYAMKQLLWNQELPSILDSALSLINTSEVHLRTILNLQPDSPLLTATLIPLRENIRITQKHYKKAHAFVEALNHSQPLK